MYQALNGIQTIEDLIASTDEGTDNFFLFSYRIHLIATGVSRPQRVSHGGDVYDNDKALFGYISRDAITASHLITRARGLLREHCMGDLQKLRSFQGQHCRIS